MPGPSPGMDPYLEASRFWHGFDGFLIAEITSALNAGLPPELAANAEERVYILTPRNYIIPTKLNIPLTGNLPDFELDLQAAVNQAYDTGPYRRRIDSSQEPPIPQDAETAAWVDALLRPKGLR